MGEANRKPSVESLTAQERECLRLVAQSLSSKEIARELGISKASVDTYCNRARAKLGVADRRTAGRLVLAADAGLVTITGEPPSASPDPVATPPAEPPVSLAVGLTAGHLLPPMSALGLRQRMAVSVLVAALLALAFGMLLAGMEALNLAASHAYAVAVDAAHNASK